jgi:hypothetical protein
MSIQRHHVAPRGTPRPRSFARGAMIGLALEIAAGLVLTVTILALFWAFAAVTP